MLSRMQDMFWKKHNVRYNIKGDRQSYRYTNAGRKRSTTVQPTTWQLDGGGDDDNGAARVVEIPLLHT
jgi:hypothetical protein